MRLRFFLRLLHQVLAQVKKITFEEYQSNQNYVCCFMIQRPDGMWDAVAFRENIWDIWASATGYQNKNEAWEDLMQICDSQGYIPTNIQYEVIK